MPGENLLIISAGGLGLVAVQIAKAITNSNILIMDVDDKKLKEANKLDADISINFAFFRPSQDSKKFNQWKGMRSFSRFCK